MLEEVDDESDSTKEFRPKKKREADKKSQPDRQIDERQRKMEMAEGHLDWGSR